MSIWRIRESIETLNAGRAGTLIGHLDIEFSQVGDDYLCATMPVDERTKQPHGLLHGGASVVLAETVGSMGATMCVDRTKYLCVGQEINANHVRAARSGRVMATARPAHLGGRTQVWTIEIVDERGELVCISRLTMAVVGLGTIPGAAQRSARSAAAPPAQ